MQSYLKSFRQLNSQQIAQLRQLIQVCFQHDGYYAKLYWNQLMERDTDQLQDWFYAVDGQLLGYAGVFHLLNQAPSIAIIVHPSVRRKLIATTLWQAVSTDLLRLGWSHARLVVSRQLSIAPWLEKQAGRILQQHVAMRCLQVPIANLDNHKLSLRRVTTETDITNIAKLHAVGFKQDPEIQRLVYKDYLNSSNASGWLALGENGEAVASACCETLAQPGFIVTNFTVHPDYRGQGYGRSFLLQLLTKLQPSQEQPGYIEALSTEEKSLELYQSCGFKELDRHDHSLISLSLPTMRDSMPSTQHLLQKNCILQLMAELYPIYEVLYNYIKSSHPDINLSEPAKIPELSHESLSSRWCALCNKLALNEFEKKLLLLCIGQELVADFTILYSYASGDPTINYPTLDLALRLFHGNITLFAPDSPLRRWQIIEINSMQTLLRNPLRIAERVLYYLLGLEDRKCSLPAWIQPSTCKAINIPSYQIATKYIESLWQAESPGFVQLIGHSYEQAQQIAALLGDHTARRVITVNLQTIPIGNNWETIRIALEREIILENYLVLVNASEYNHDQLSFERKQQLQGLLNQLALEFATAIVIYVNQPILDLQSLPQIVHMHPLSFEEQTLLWQSYLPENHLLSYGDLFSTCQQFCLNWRQIAAVSQSYSLLMQQNKPQLKELWGLCQQQLSQNYNDKVRPIKTKAQITDLVISAETTDLLKQIINQVKYRYRVYHELGLAKRRRRGLGISILFTGPSGTGKTTAAEIIAHELQLELLHIELSGMVSKYVGETEKNIREVFLQAEKSGAILLFDEADALFGKRSNQVQSSNDRHSNMEISYLLQQMEAYQGLSILTTNLPANMDSAFIRRFRFSVPFSLPDQAQRRQIWRQAFPEEVQLGNIDWEKLEQLELSGANIQMIATNAIFLAVSQDKPLELEHILLAARQEFIKIGKLNVEY